MSGVWPPGAQGQLWEECERCGEEPVYMPLMLCAKCWPKTKPPVIDDRPGPPGERFDPDDEA